MEYPKALRTHNMRFLGPKTSDISFMFGVWVVGFGISGFQFGSRVRELTLVACNSGSSYSAAFKQSCLSWQDALKPELQPLNPLTQ